ncbi:Macrophage colony-stimulating factor 1 receptor [Basidiobolus ranarum]|uniref:Macrophage colony-stimulating factor 1 receptor n=1 Tax=Basidiobolus ranarum TaxID=34480 RepID=A0ABR2WL31_9FUNG
MFGPLPHTNTYVCDWKFDIGSILGRVGPNFLVGLNSFLDSFVFNFVDRENTFPVEFQLPSFPDLTLLKVGIADLDFIIWAGGSVSQLLIKDGIRIDFNNLINEEYDSKAYICVPELVLRFMTISEKQSDQMYSDLENEEIPWVEVANVETALNISAYVNTADWKDRRQKQQSFVRQEDRETLRCSFVYEDDTNTIYETSSIKVASDNHLNGTYIPPLMSTILDGYNEPSPDTYSNSIDDGLPALFPNPQNILLNENAKAFWPVCDSPTDMDAEFDFDEEHHTPQQNENGYLEALSLNYSGSSRTGSLLSRWEGANNDRISSYYTVGGNDSDSDVSYYIDESDEDGNEKAPSYNQKERRPIPPKPVSIPYYKYLKRYKMTGDSKHDLSDGNLCLKPPSTMFADLSEANTETSAFYRHSTKASFQSQNNSSILTWLRQDPTYKEASSTEQEDDLEESKVESTMVIECPEHIKILLTPVFFKIVQDLVQSMDSQEWSIESILDSIQIDNVVKPLQLENLLCKSMKYMIGIPRVHLHLIQDVTLPDDFTSNREEFPYARTRYDLSDTLLSTMDIVLDDLMVNVFIKAHPKVPGEMAIVDSRVLLDFSQLRVNLRFVGIGIFGISENRLKKLPLDFINYSDNEPVVLDLSYDRFHLEWLGNKKPNSLKISLEDFSAIFLHEAVEIVFGAAVSWLTFVNDMKSVLATFQKKRSKRVQYLVATISDYSATNTVGPDPAFLSRVSGVRRLGVKEVFVNDSWRLMTRIRHCSRSMPIDSMRRLKNSLRDQEIMKWNLNSVFSIVISNFSKWRFWEFEKLDSCVLLTNIFGKEGPQASPNSLEDDIFEFLRSSENCFGMRLNKVGLHIYGENEAEDNSMVIGPVQLDSETDYLDNNSSASVLDDEKVYGQPSREDLDPFINIILCAKIHQIDIALKPTVLTFVKHLLHVNRCFSSVFDTFSETDESELSKVQSDEVADGFDIARFMSKMRFSAHSVLFLDQINVVATVENWVTQIKLDSIKLNGISHNLLVKSSPSSTKATIQDPTHLPIFADASSSIDSISLILQERIIVENHKHHTQLLSFDIHGIGVNAAFDSSKIAKNRKLLENNEPNYVNIFVKVKGLSLKVPQNLIKLYNFVEKWKTENLPNYDFLINRLLAEWESHKKNVPPKTLHMEKAHNHKTTARPIGLKLQFLLKQITFQSDVTPSLNFRYDILDFLGYLQSNSIEFDNKKQGLKINYSVQILKQNVHFVTKHKVPSQGENKNENHFNVHQQAASFSIPAIRSEGQVEPVNDHFKLESIIIIDFIRLTLNANLIDQLLTTHILLSSEFNDVIDVFLYSTRKIKERRSKLNLLPTGSSEPPKNSLLFTNKISFKGFRVAAVSPVAVILFESDVLHGYISNLENLNHLKNETNPTPLSWKIFANKFSVSLNHNAGNIGDYMESTISRDDPSMLKYRMAFILMDLVIQNWTQEPMFDENGQQKKPSSMESFFIKFLKVHAVMQPIALGKSADLYIYVNQEFVRRKEMKTMQIKKLTQDTKRILRSLDVEVPKYKDKGRSFFEDKLISVQINKLAIAILLEKHDDVISAVSAVTTPSSKPRSKPKYATAFLFSVRYVDLSTKRLEKSHGLVNDLCLQFIPQFDQSNEKCFSPIQNSKMNRVFLPVIECNVYSRINTTRHKIQIDAHVEGFEVDIEPTVVEHINNLDDIWQHNKLKFSSLTNENAASSPQQQADSSNHSEFSPKAVDESSTLHMVSLELETSFNFSSGTCRFYPKMSKMVVTDRISTKNSSDNGTPMDIGVGVFVVPGLSLHCVFVTPIGEYARSVIDPAARRIYLEIMIHPSENIIYPSVIPFIKDILFGLKLGVQRSSEKKHVTKVENPTSVIQEFSVSLYLRLSQTRFDLSCQPASKVALSLLWEEGNFLMSSGNENAYHGITCTGNIKGASVVVQHAFSPEHCLLGETRNILFNMTMMSRNDSIANENSVSVIAQISEIRGDFNMRHFQDFLLFKKVWFDRSIDQFTAKEQAQHSDASEESHVSDETEPNEEAEHPKPFSVFVAVSLKHVDIAGDLGQAIGKVYFSTENINFNTTRVPGTFRSLTSTIGNIELKSEGRLKGSATLDGIQIVMNVKSLPAVIENSALHNWLNIQLTLGQIATSFEYEYQRILVAEIDPIVFDLKDQWDNINSEEAKVNIHLRLMLKEVEIISSIKTHPVFVGIANKLILVVEEKRRLAFDSMSSTYFVENPKKVKSQAATKSTSVTPGPKSQHILIGKKSILPTGEISLTLERAQLTLYPNRFSDNDFVQGKLEGLNIELKRYIALEKKINRSLVLKFATVAISKNRCKKLELQDENRLSIGEWIRHISESSSKNVLYLPSTKMEMLTEQVFNSHIIEHQFTTDFVGRVDIALNFTLYKYLIELTSLYKSQLKSSACNGKEKDLSSDTPKQRTINNETARKNSVASLSDKTNDTNKPRTQELVYKALEPIRLDPQLKLMGDATPPLEWIGLQRQRVPEAIHDHVTSNLEELLLIVQGLYVEQISKGAH